MSKRQDPSQAVSRTAALLLRPLHKGLGLWSRGVAFARCRENALLAARVLPASRLEGPGVGRWLRRGRGAGPPGPAPGRLPGTTAPRSPLPSRPAACTPTAARASWGKRHAAALPPTPRGTSAVTGTLFFDRPLRNLLWCVIGITGCQPKDTISW